MWGGVGRCGEMWGDVGRCGEIWGDVGRYGEMWGGVGRCGEMWGDVGRCGEMWGDVGRCGEMWGDVGRCGEMWGDVGRCGARRSRGAAHRLGQLPPPAVQLRQVEQTRGVGARVSAEHLGRLERRLEGLLCPIKLLPAELLSRRLDVRLPHVERLHVLLRRVVTQVVGLLQVVRSGRIC